MVRQKPSGAELRSGYRGEEVGSVHVDESFKRC